jgi:hypothetical protein
MSPQDYRSTNPDIKRNVRTVSPSNSISSSQQASEIDNHPTNSKHDHHQQQNRSEQMNWSLLVPVIGMTILTWAQQTNARVRQHATACCSGDFCIGTDTVGPAIPEEISFQKCKNHHRTSIDIRSVATPTSLHRHHHHHHHATATTSGTNHSGVEQYSNATTDIELTTFEASSIIGTTTTDVNDGLEYDTSWTVPHPIRRTKWNEIPDDPVDEVSLKGSSMYMSSSEDDEVVLPYHNDDDDDCDNHHIDVRKLQHRLDRVTKFQ